MNRARALPWVLDELRRSESSHSWVSVGIDVRELVHEPVDDHGPIVSVPGPVRGGYPAVTRDWCSYRSFVATPGSS